MSAHRFPDALMPDEFRRAATALRRGQVGESYDDVQAFVAVLDYGLAKMAEGPNSRAAQAGGRPNVDTPAGAANLLDAAAAAATAAPGDPTPKDPNAPADAPAPEALPWKNIVPHLMMVLGKWLEERSV